LEGIIAGMKNILLVFGTRPEAIKMAPLVKALQTEPVITAKVCVTAQHRHMLDQVLHFFNIVPDYDLNLMKPGQNLYQLTADVLVGLKTVLEDFKPDLVIVHGDTSTSTAAALAAYYYGAKIAHIEAGLRTYDKQAPFPEEINRQLTGRLADLHFSPTEQAKANLLREGIDPYTVYVTGNTVIDALFEAAEKLKSYRDTEIEDMEQKIDSSKKLILVTAHRRENFGVGMDEICKALRELAKRSDVQIVFPVHLNPQVQKPVYQYLGKLNNVLLLSPLGYPAFTWLMIKSYLILTDSGGIQEEGPSIGKPVLVMRETSERPEAIDAGTVKLVGANCSRIYENVTALLDQEELYQRMSKSHNPYGDGKSCKRILSAL